MIKTKCEHSRFTLVNKLTAKADISTKIINDSNERLNHYWLFALQLEEYKYFIGTTTRQDPYDHIKKQSGFFGARWTRMYKPKRVLEIRDLGYISQAQADDLENKLTQEYVKVYGAENARGRVRSQPERYLVKINRFFTKNDYYAIAAIAILLLIIICLAAALIIDLPPTPIPS